jgi:signal transduction histidine kinase
MVVRLGSLKTRTAVAIATIIAAVLVANAVYLILTKRAELRQDIEERAATFAQLSKGPVCAAYDQHYSSGRYKFRELLRDALRLNPDVSRILILSVDGQILYDSRELEEGAPVAAGWIREHDRLEALKRLEQTVLRGRTAEGHEMMEIIAPYVEEWGRHRLSVAYQVSYQALGPRLSGLVYATAALTLVSILAAAVVAVALATRITQPLEQLTAGAQDVAEGRLERRLDIRSGDEMQLLAETFNHMSARLQENIQKLEESNRKLASANDELKELDRMKSDLLANVSHELRTPLTAIKGYTDYILDGRLGTVTQKQEKGLVVVQRNLDRLSRSISALLDFSRMDAGRIPLEIAPFSLPALVEPVVTALRSEVEKKGLRLEVALEPDLPPLIGDREKLGAVIENLVVNAIKFTAEGGSITVSAARLPDRRAVQVRVSDTGIGIPGDQIEKVFQRFHQVDSSTTRRYGGVGLGLAIVKSILDAHGTHIGVESRIGHGTAFQFTLPVLERHEAPAGGGEKAEGARPAPSVLVLHHGGETAERIRDTLMTAGFRPVLAADGQEALLAVARERPDVVVMRAARAGQAEGDAERGLREALDRAAAGVPVVTMPSAETDIAVDPQAVLAEVRRHLGPAEARPAPTPAMATRS